LEDLQITADFQKIELEVFEEEENTTETEQTETEA